MDVIQIDSSERSEHLHPSDLKEVKHEERVIAEPFPIVQYDHKEALYFNEDKNNTLLTKNPVSDVKSEEIVIPVTIPDTEEKSWDGPAADFDLKDELAEEEPNLLQSNFCALAHDGSSPTDYESHFNKKSKVRRRKAQKEKPFQCDICGSGFAFRKTLVIHLRIHTGEKIYKCNVCGNSYARRSDLLIHERRHTGEKPFRCTVCGKEFAHRGNLVTHDRSHTGEKPYPCKVCGKCFGHLGHLVTHGRIHTGERPYKCSLCSKDFAQRCQLDRHTRSHTGEKPYSCSTCGKAFSQRGHLMRHAQGHTNK